MTSAMGYRPDPPATPDLVRWPDDFGTRFTIFVDTEEEFDWDAPLDRTNRSTRAMAALPAAHRRFADRGIGLTYLVDHPVATSPMAVAILNDLLGDGRSAIGTQLHPWVNPPFDEPLTRVNSFPGNLPEGIEAAKIDALTNAIEQAFGAAPLVYRAGRYGIGPRTLGLLAARGYRIDSSMRARYDYSRQGGPDFAAIGNAAFRGGPGGGVVELPLTTLFTGMLRARGDAIYPVLARIPHGAGAAARLGLLARVALTPEEMPLRDALEAIRVAEGEGIHLLNFSFHSPTVAIGETQFVRDEAGLAAFHRWWDGVLDLLDRRGVRPASHDEIVEALDRAR